MNIERLLMWSETFFGYLNTKMTAWGVSAAWVAGAGAKLADLQRAHAVWVNPATRTKAAHADMEAKRAIYVDAVEPLVQNLRSLPMLEPQDYSILQIAPPNRGPRPKYPPIKTWPVLTVKVHGQCTVSLDYHDVETPLSRAKPRGAQSVLIRIGFPAETPDAPEDLTDMLLTLTRAPHRITFAPEYAGRKLCAIGAWISTTGKQGSWGPFVEVILS
ncbi:MAG: hypothetical protein LBR86_08650 [Tannerella sp.]|nr:hypothetical protein [Tannerella sp.]